MLWLVEPWTDFTQRRTPVSSMMLTGKYGSIYTGLEQKKNLVRLLVISGEEYVRS